MGARTVCAEGHDLTYPGATKVRSKGDNRYIRVCVVCDRATRYAQRRDAAIRAAATRIRKQEAARLAEQAVEQLVGAPVTLPPAPPEEEDDEERLGPNAKHSPYILTRRLLEAEWGVPIARWTREQHQQHNVAMYRILGWPDDGPPRHGTNHLPTPPYRDRTDRSPR